MDHIVLRAAMSGRVNNMKTLKFFIPGNPVSKGRPRFVRIKRFVKTYTPEKTEKWERLVALISAKQRFQRELPTCPLRATMTFYLPRPKSLPKKTEHHTKKPDLDNLIKSVIDGMQGVLFYSDSQIYMVNALKMYSVKNQGVAVELIYAE